MKGDSDDLYFLSGAPRGPTLPRRTIAGSKSPSPDRIHGRLTTLKSPSINRPCQGNDTLRLTSFPISSVGASPDRSCKTVTRSPIKRTPTLPTMEEANSQAEAADRGGALHVPASAPTSSARSSPQPSAQRVLSLAPSPITKQSPSVSPSKLPLGPLPPQSPPNKVRETGAASKQGVGQSRPPRQSSSAFHDENSPVRESGSPDSLRMGQLPPGVQTCGDLNEDVKQWEEHEKEVCYYTCKPRSGWHVLLESRMSYSTHITTLTCICSRLNVCIIGSLVMMQLQPDLYLLCSMVCLMMIPAVITHLMRRAHVLQGPAPVARPLQAPVGPAHPPSL